MSGIFDFFLDGGNYKDRVVDHYEVGELVIDTVSVSDGAKPYETGIQHPDYNHGNWVIVEAYDTKEDAQAGHDKWVTTMTAEPLPESLADCKNANALNGAAVTLNIMNLRNL